MTVESFKFVDHIIFVLDSTALGDKHREGIACHSYITVPPVSSLGRHLGATFTRLIYGIRKTHTYKEISAFIKFIFGEITSMLVKKNEVQS